MVLAVLLNLMILSSNRIYACIKIVALQGVLIGILPLFVNMHGLSFNTLFIAGSTIVLKGIVFPWFLFYAIRGANVRREVEPFVGYTLSIMAGIAALMISFWLSSRLPVPGHVFSEFVIPVSFSTIFTGLFVIISRKKALTQVLGYLVLENGIYSLGIAFLLEQPLLVEMGILLDVFVAVFVMGIAIFHINQEFDHIDTHKFLQLTDIVPAEPEVEK
jgi:hydrogenase-4 component E